MYDYGDDGVDCLEGRQLSAIIVADDDSEVLFKTEDGNLYKMHHYQDCCEHVLLEEIHGDLTDLIGTPIVEASERGEDKSDGDSFYQTWTFYEFRTIKGSVTLRWYGTSNGYYSTAVSFEKVS